MAYIGNQPTTAAFVTDLFSGDGVTTAFTMSVSPANTASILVAVSGVLQSPDTYSTSGLTLTFSAAPPAGTGNISVRYLGIPATNVTTTAYRTVTEFTATASQTTFSVPSYTAGYIDVYRNGVRLGLTDYTATNGTTVVLANAATVGDLVTTESFYVSSVLNAIPSTGGAINNIYLDTGNANGTGALKLPVGTTGQRPTGAAGYIRQNSTTGNPEWWDATTSSWLQFSQPAGYLITYLLVAGGGGGGGAGGGGGGGVLAGASTLSSGTTYTITVGAGGTSAAAGTNTSGTQGNSTTAFTLTAIGGGGGGAYTAGGSAGAGGNGGSGGGGGSTGSNVAGGSGTAGQGNAGGNGTTAVNPYAGGGGGGGGGVGSNGSANYGGAGGIGASSSITGTTLYWGGGGGGGAQYGSNAAYGGAGGLGGGGGGAAYGSSGNGGTGGGQALNSGSSGTLNNSGPSGGSGGANTGGGGGGMGISVSIAGTGGSGIAVISYYGSQRGTGGTVTTSGGYTIHTFTSSGTYIA